MLCSLEFVGRVGDQGWHRVAVQRRGRRTSRKGPPAVTARSIAGSPLVAAG